MRKYILIAAAVVGLSLSAGVSQAAGGFAAGIIGGEYAGQSYSGSATGYGQSATTGGSMAQTENYGTGLSLQHSSNDGYGYAGAGGFTGPEGSVSYTAGGSGSNAVSGGFSTGNGYGETAGGVGTDYSANSWSNFETGGFGGSFGAAGYAGFAGFTF